MEAFRKKIENKLKLCIFICLFYPAAMFMAKHFFNGASDFSQGMILGVCIGGMVVAVFYAARNYAALQDEEKLKKLYIELTDERNNEISKETMKTASTVCMVVISLAVIISGFINETVSITLAADIFVSAIITVIVNAYYKKKM